LPGAGSGSETGDELGADAESLLRELLLLEGGWSAPDLAGCDTDSLADLLEEERADGAMPRWSRAL